MDRTATTGEGPGGRFREPRRYEGYEVLDPLGKRVGYAEKVFVNGGDEPEYIRVRTGFLAPKSFLLPVQDVRVDEGRRSLTLG